MQHGSFPFLRSCSARACSPSAEGPGLDISSAFVSRSTRLSSTFPSRERSSSAPSLMSSAGGLSSELKLVRREASLGSSGQQAGQPFPPSFHPLSSLLLA